MDSKSPRNNNHHHHHHNHHQAATLLPSPRSSSSSSSTSNNGAPLPHHNNNLTTPTTVTSPPSPYPPKPITRSESANPYPTTFVQADTSSFKQVVQMLTGSTETAKQASSEAHGAAAANKSHHHHHHIPPIKTMPRKQSQQHQSGFKLYERRNSLKNLKLNPLLPVFSSSHHSAGFSPRKPEVLSPSILDFPALVLSPVTPLLPDPFHRAGAAAGNGYRCGNRSPSVDTEAEEKAIKEKGFFLHPSPSTTPRDPEPRLLPLFPTTSPRASGSSSSS